MVAGRPGARVGGGLAREHEVDRGQRAVDGGACRLPGPGADERHRVVGEVARPRPDRGRSPARAQRRVCEDVRDDPALARVRRQARRLPLVPGRGEVRGELRGRGPASSGLVGVRLGVDDPARPACRGWPSTRAGTSVAGVRTPTQISLPARGGGSDRSRRPASASSTGRLYTPPVSEPPEPRGPRPRELGLRVGSLEPGAEQLDRRRSRRDGRPRDGLARRARAARGARRRAHRRDGVVPGRLPLPARGRGPERRRRADRLARDPRVGPDGDARLPDRDDGGRADLRRRGLGRLGRRSARGGGRRPDPGRRRVRRQPSQRRTHGSGRGRGRGPRGRGRLGVADRRGRRRRGHRDELPGLERRHRHGEPVGRGLLARSARAGELRLGARAAGRRRPGRPPAGRGGAARRSRRAAASSCVATDAPLPAAALERVARRAGLGLARIGLGRPPRQRRDLRRLLHHPGCGELSRATCSTSCSPRPSSRPRRRC